MGWKKLTPEQKMGVGGLGAIGIGVGAQIFTGIMAGKKAREAKWDADQLKKDQQALIDSRQDLINPYEDLTNQFANMSVAVKASEFQAEEADIALANTLDTLRATGASAGGATALAQAALKSKRGISANLEAQETANEKLRAQGEAKVQELKAKGEQFKWSAQETREMAELDRSQAEIDLMRMQEMQYQSGQMQAFGGIAGTLTSGMESMANIYAAGKD